MDEKTAWANFVSTGSVIDYLEYREIKESHIKPPQEEIYANQHRRTDYHGTEYR